MHSLRVPYFFFTKNIGAPQGDTLGLIYPLSNKSYICIVSSISSGVLILYKALEIGAESDMRSLEKSISLLGGRPSISSGKMSLNSWSIG